MSLLQKVKKNLSQSQIDFIKKVLRNKTSASLLGKMSKGNLQNLALFYGTDKWGSHWYMQHYETHFNKFKNKNIKLLEIGVGGYSDPGAGGGSLKVWKNYFRKGQIYSFDIYDKSALQEDRIRIFKGDQTDPVFLKKIIDETGELDIIIDDGSHINQHVIKSFEILFPHLKDGGIYVIEDTQTSYWESDGGDSNNLQNPSTIQNFFKRLTDCPNYKEYIRPGYKPSYYDQHIVSIHFYHNMIFVCKGLNDEDSTAVINNVSKKQLV